MANNGTPSLPRQASGSVVSAPTGYLDIFADSGTGKLASVDEAGVVTAYGLTSVDESNIYYFGKHGSDSNDGKSHAEAVLTIDQAITLAIAETPSISNGFAIVGQDGGIYTESFTVPSYVTIVAPGATISGNVSLEGFSGINVLQVNAVFGNAVEKNADDDTASIRAALILAIAGSTNGVVCTQGDLLINIQQIQVVDGSAILNSGATSEIHGTVSSIELSGTGEVVKSTGASSNTSLFVNQIKDTGGSGFGVDVDFGHVHLFSGEFNPDSGGDVASGARLDLFVSDINSKTFTGSGTINITESGIVADHASNHTDGTDDIQDSTASVKGLATATQITKLDGIEAAADVTDATNVNAAGATMNTDTTMAGNGYFLDEDTLGSDDATKVASQQSIKAYVDATAGGTDPWNVFFDNFITGNTDSDEVGELGWRIQESGTGSIVNSNIAEAGHAGILELQAGTAVGAKAAIHKGDPTIVHTHKLDADQPEITHEWLVKFTGSVAAADMERFTCGFGDQFSSGTGGVEIDNGVYVELIGAASPVFTLRTANSSTRSSSAGSTVAALNTWYRLGVKMTYPGGTPTAEMFINGVKEGSSITTNIPGNTGIGIRIDAGPTNSTEAAVLADWCRIQQTAGVED